MNELSVTCRRDGCSDARAKYSVFCERHHQEQLKVFGLAPSPRRNAGLDLYTRVQRLAKHHYHQAITTEEFCSQLFELFIYARVRGTNEPFGTSLDALPVNVLAELLEFASTQTEPRVYRRWPTDIDEQDRELRAALAAQAELIGLVRNSLR